MKKKLVTQKILGSAMIIIMLLTASVNQVAGQVQMCEGVNYTISATGTGCTKAAAKLAMRTNAAALAVAVCPGKLCPQDTISPCVLKSITVVTGITYTSQNDPNCPQPHLRWTATRTYAVTCKCIHVPQPQRDEVIVPDDLMPYGSLSIFPNPASQQIFVDVTSYYGAARFQVINVLGQQTFGEAVDLDGLETYTLDISSFAPGIYKLILANDSNFAVGTFVKGAE